MPKIHIVGTGRCGSTLLAHILNLHPRVSIAFTATSDFLFYQAGRALGFPNSSGIAQSTYDYKPTATHRGIHLADRWDVAAAGDRAVLLIRDPRDMAVSWRCHAERQSRDVRDILLGVTAQQWAEFWSATCRPPVGSMIRVLRYEDLIERPAVMAKICWEHFGLDPLLTSNAFDFCDLFRRHGTTSGSPALSIDRWRDELSGDDSALIAAICRPVMRFWGY